MRRLTFGSLFSGIGGIDLGFERSGMDCRWQVEINPFRRKVLATHWPEVSRYEDIKECGSHNLEPVDCITAGVPCQDWSVAGRRAGISGSRSGLFFECLRILKELRPCWFVFENVPGLISSNEGEDLRLILDSLGELGYIADIDICDSQNFGVPQRRRRVFIVCQHVDHLLQKRTISSVATIGQCITEILLGALAEACEASSIELPGSTFAKCASEGGIWKRMRLFGLATVDHWVKLLKDWDEMSLLFLKERGTLGFHLVEPKRDYPVDIFCESSLTAASEPISGHIRESWKSIWDVLSGERSWSTILTETRSTIPSPIFGCAQIVSTISWRTALLNECCLNCSDAASSSLTALKGFTAYAKSTSNQLFGELRWIREWRCFEAYSEYLLSHPFNDLGTPCPPEILFERPGGHRDSEESEKAGKEVSHALTGSSVSSGYRFDPNGEDYVVSATVTKGSGVTGNPPGRRREDDYNLVSATITPGSGRVGSRGADDGVNIVYGTLKSHRTGGWTPEPGEHLVASTLTSRSSPKGHGAAGPRVEDIPNFIIQDVRGGNRIKEGGPCYTLSKTERHGASRDVAFSLRKDPGGTGQGHNTNYVSEKTYPDRGGNTPGLSEGLDDPWPLLPKGLDSPRYQALGDAVTVQVAEWIGRRIVRFLESGHCS